MLCCCRYPIAQALLSGAVRRKVQATNVCSTTNETRESAHSRGRKRDIRVSTNADLADVRFPPSWGVGFPLPFFLLVGWLGFFCPLFGTSLRCATAAGVCEWARYF